MKQTINLLPAKAKQTKDLLAFSNLMLALALILVSGVAITSGLWWHANNVIEQKDLQAARNNQLQNQLSQLSSQLATRNTPKELTLELKKIDSQILAMEQVSELSIDIDPAQNTGFLDTLQQINSNLPEQTRIDQLQLNQHKTLTKIAGEVTSVNLLPLLVAGLKEQQLLPNFTKTSAVNNGTFFRFEVVSTNGGQ